MLRQRLMAWLYSGADRTRSFSLRRKILHVNAVALLAMLFMAGFDFAYAATGSAVLTRSIAIHLPVFVLAALTPWLNRRGSHDVARWALALALPGMVALTVALVSGSYLSLHFLFIVIAMITVALFPLKQSFGAAILVLLNVAAFAYCEYNGVLPHSSLYALPESTVVGFRAGYIGTMVFSVLVIAWLGEFATEQNERELESLSGIDPLTQLPNRRRIMERLAEALQLSRRLGEFGGVLFVDLDNFKEINDLHGHEGGDLLLQEVARRLGSTSHALRIAARLGGDEFVVVLASLGHHRDEALELLRGTSELFCSLLAEPYRLSLPVPGEHNSTEVKFTTASIGATLFSGADSSPDAILQRADSAMYRAKAEGKHRVQLDQG